MNTIAMSAERILTNWSVMLRQIIHKPALPAEATTRVKRFRGLPSLAGATEAAALHQAATVVQAAGSPEQVRRNQPCVGQQKGNNNHETD